MLGSHAIDITLWMMDDREPVSVLAQGTSNNPDFEEMTILRLSLDLTMEHKQHAS